MFPQFQFTSPFVDRFKYVVYGCTNYADRADNGLKKTSLTSVSLFVFLLIQRIGWELSNLKSMKPLTPKSDQ